MENPDLIEFYGTECPHCVRMQPIIKQFEKKHKTKLTKLEVWHNDENKGVLKAISEFKQCNGVPFFYNRETKKIICGECTLEELERWAK